MMKRYLRQLGQIVMLNLVFFLLFTLYLKQVYNPATPSLKKQILPSVVNVSPGGLPTVPQVPDSNNADTPGQTNPPTDAPQDKSAQLSSHNNPSDCWIAIGGQIYDITSYFGSHPGGDATLGRYCGQDATNGFETKDKSPGMSHSDAARAMLQQFLIQ